MREDLRDAKEPSTGRSGDKVFQEEVTARAEAAAEMRWTSKRKRKEDSVRGWGGWQGELEMTLKQQGREAC